MTTADGLSHAVDNVVSRCLRVCEGENVVVVADTATQAIGDRLRAGARAAGAEVVLAIMDPGGVRGAEPPAPVAAALRACDVYVVPTTRSLSHTAARLAASTAGARGATLPGVTAAMLGRLMGGDVDLVGRRARAITTALSTGHSAELSCPRGSRMTFWFSDRAGIADDGVLSEPGAFGNLPCGEAFIAPSSGHGHLVARSLAPFGLSEPPATLTVRDGELVDADGGLGPRFLDLLRGYGRPARNLAELGVGTNDRATLTGNVLEDEKLLGSVHVAFGASAAIGGSVAVPIHLDVIVTEASLAIDGWQILDEGRLVLDV